MSLQSCRHLKLQGHVPPLRLYFIACCVNLCTYLSFPGLLGYRSHLMLQSHLPLSSGYHCPSVSPCVAFLTLAPQMFSPSLIPGTPQLCCALGSSCICSWRLRCQPASNFPASNFRRRVQFPEKCASNFPKMCVQFSIKDVHDFVPEKARPIFVFLRARPIFMRVQFSKGRASIFLCLEILLK